MKFWITTITILLALHVHAQKTSISYELNGRSSNIQIQDSLELSKNPFAKFIGEWTLKNDIWIQNWGSENDTLKISEHHTISAQINTENSLLSIIDGPEPNGHIFWSYNPNTREVDHLSSFGTNRAGVGKGKFYGKGNLKLKVSFEGEALGTYRIYTYNWINDNEYALLSVQYDKNDKPTGLFYKGNFIRENNKDNLQKAIKKILNVLDDHRISKEQQIKVYADDIVHMAPNQEVINNKQDLLTYLNKQKSFGYAKMEHKIDDLTAYGDLVIMRGSVSGFFYPVNDVNGVQFRTKNLIIFKRINGMLKITKVIYNMSPIE